MVLHIIISLVFGIFIGFVIARLYKGIITKFPLIRGSDKMTLDGWTESNDHPLDSKKGTKKRIHLIYSPSCAGCKAAQPRLEALPSQLSGWSFTKSRNGPPSVKWVPIIMVERPGKDLELLSGNMITFDKINTLN